MAARPWLMSRPFLVNKQASLWVPCSGAVERTRTSDLLITNQLLYQLSYNGAERNYNKKPLAKTTHVETHAIAVTLIWRKDRTANSA